MGTLKIEGFKCFSGKEIPIKRMTILAGGNSVGKSSIIQILLLLRSSNLEDLTPLNGDYLLNLGNSSQVIKTGYSSNNIFAKYKFDESNFVETTWEANINRPQVYLNVLKKNHTPTCNLITQNFHYLHAERLGPRSFYSIGIKERSVGWQGENTIALLSNTIIDTPEYNVAPEKQFKKKEENTNPTLGGQVDLWMNYIVPGVDVRAERVQEINQAFVQFNNNAPYNVGFGISYVLPIIVAGLIAQKGEMLIIENPEAHLHPSGQSRIGKFLAAVAKSGTQVIIETHSEHVVNGVRLASLENVINHEDVVINFFNAPEDIDEQPNVDSIFLNDKADLEKWPVGFFDQQQQDIAEIFRLRKDQLI